MDETHALFRFGYVAMAALAGAVTALGFRNWKTMTPTEIGLTVVSSFSFAVFVGPWAASALLGIPASSASGTAMVVYTFGSGSNILLPVVIRWFGRAFGNGEPKNGE